MNGRQPRFPMDKDDVVVDGAQRRSPPQTWQANSAWCFESTWGLAGRVVRIRIVASVLPAASYARLDVLSDAPQWGQLLERQWPLCESSAISGSQPAIKFIADRRASHFFADEQWMLENAALMFDLKVLVERAGPHKSITVPSLGELRGAQSVLQWMRLKCGAQDGDTLKMIEQGIETGIDEAEHELNRHGRDE